MGALVVLVGLVAGPPLLLAKVAGWPLRGWPSLQQARLWIAQPLTQQTLVGALTILAWLLWLLVAYTVIVVLARRIRTGARWLRRLPLPTPFQATATGVAGAAVFVTSAHTTPTVPAPQPLAVAAGTLDHDEPGDDTQTTPAADRAFEAGEGVAVPGGWLPNDTATQVAAAAALVWLRRRRGYQPGPAASPNRDNPDLAPLPAIARAVQAAVGTEPPQASAVDDGRPFGQAAPASIGGLPAAGVTFTGPGAHHAARGVLVTALLAAVRHAPAAVGVVITGTALSTLLDVPATGTVRGDIPGLRLTGNVEEALTLIESHLASARSHLGERPGATATDEAAPLVLITDAAPTPSTDRLAGLLASGRVGAVVLNSWPAGVTWHVDPHGHTHEVDRPRQAGPRLCVLDPQATRDLLTVITGTDPTPADACQQVAFADPDVPHAQQRHRLVVTGHRIPRQAAGEHDAPATSTTATRPPAQLRVLGKPTLIVGDGSVTIRRTAALHVLVFLAVHSQGASSRQLTQAIWPGLPAHTVTGRLYTTLSELRAAIRAACGLTVIDHSDDRYRLNPEHVEADLWRLQAAAHHAATTLGDRVAAWQAVIDSYTGDLAAGHTWGWIDPPREATRRLVIDAYAAAASGQPDPRDALQLLQDGIRVDPYNENLHRRAMETLTGLGEHAAAADLYDAYTRRLTLAGLPASDTFHQIRPASSARPDLQPGTSAPRA